MARVANSCCFFMVSFEASTDYTDFRGLKTTRFFLQSVEIREIGESLDELSFRWRSRFRHVKPEIRQQIRARDEPEESVVFHYDGDATAVKYIEQILNCGVWRQRL